MFWAQGLRPNANPNYSNDLALIHQFQGSWTSKHIYLKHTKDYVIYSTAMHLTLFYFVISYLTARLKLFHAPQTTLLIPDRSKSQKLAVDQVKTWIKKYKENS